MPRDEPKHVSAQVDLNRRFFYRAEPGDEWRILKGEADVYGDCEDYALTLIWLIEGQSMLRFWWALLTFKYVIWFCVLPGRVGHAVLWRRGTGWTDNIMTNWRRELPAHYRLRFPFVVPLVALKFFLRGLLRR